MEDSAPGEVRILIDAVSRIKKSFLFAPLLPLPPSGPYIRKVVLIYDYGTCPDRFFPFSSPTFSYSRRINVKTPPWKRKGTLLRHFFLFFKKIQFCGKVGTLGRNPFPTSIAHSIWQQSSFCDNKFFCGNKGERGRARLGQRSFLLLPTLLFTSFFPFSPIPSKPPREEEEEEEHKRIESWIESASPHPFPPRKVERKSPENEPTTSHVR